MKVSQSEFKSKYGGSLDALRNKAALSAPSESGERKKYEYREYELQKNVAGFINLYYPEVEFISNPINLNLTKSQRGMNSAIQKQNFKCPDTILFEARHGYHGLFLELKKESPYTLSGVLKSGEHLAGQREAILKLREKGYHADFYWTFEQVKKILNWYLD